MSPTSARLALAPRRLGDSGGAGKDYEGLKKKERNLVSIMRLPRFGFYIGPNDQAGIIWVCEIQESWRRVWRKVT